MARAWNVVMGVACACLCSTARADVVKLEELEARALSQRPEIAAGRARIAKAGAAVDQAESAYYPTLSANADVSLAPGRDLIPYTDPKDGRDYLISGSQTIGNTGAFAPAARYGASISARGNIYDFGRTRETLAAARAQERAMQADARARSESLVLEVRAAYLRWSVAQALWQISGDARAAAEARAAKVAGLIAEGAAPPSAQTGVALSANAAANEVERAELELESARLELGYLSARDLGPDALPDPQLLAAESQPPAAAGEPSGGGALLQALDSAREAATARQRMQAQMDAPVLAYSVRAGVDAQTAQKTSVFPNYGVGVGLSVPIWDAGATSAAEAGAQAESAELAAQSDAERARQRKLAAQRKLSGEHALRLLGLAEHGLQLADARVQQLEAGTTLATTEQQALAAAEADRSRARADVVRARASLAQLRLGLP